MGVRLRGRRQRGRCLRWIPAAKARGERRAARHPYSARRRVRPAIVKQPLSIRGRVTIAATAAVALALIAGGIFTVTTFAHRERSSLDRELERRARGPANRAAILLPALR